jgi:hypothetical protein
MFINQRSVLRVPVAETGGGGASTETVDPVNLEESLTKMFPEDEIPVDSKTAGKRPVGETIDPSKAPGGAATTEDPDGSRSGELSAEDQAALTERAKENGVTVEEQQTAEAAELERLTAITEKTGETPEQIYERETKEGKETDLETVQKKGAKVFTQEEVNAKIEDAVKKRGRKLEGEVEALRRQLNARPVTNGDALGNVTTIEKLDELRTTASTQLREAQRLTKQLGFAPNRVQKYFEDLAADEPAVAKRFKTADGFDFSVEKMADALEDAESHFQGILDAVPQREAFLKNFDKAHGVAMKVHSWLENEDDDRTAIFRQIEQSPIGRSAKAQDPTWEYWIGHAVAGHVALQARIAAARKNGGAAPGKKFVPKVKFPGTARGGGAAPQRGGKTATFATAKAKGDTAAMADALGL